MFNKKSIELSLNFIVVFIITIVIFAFGVMFISKLASNANSLTQVSTDQLDARISSLNCEGSERACIGNDRKTIERGNYDTFGLNIINILDKKEFSISITPPSGPPTGLLGYRKNNAAITNPPNPPLIAKVRDSVIIDKNEQAKIGIGVEVPKGAVSGTYILDVNIRQADTGQLYVNVQQIHVHVP